MSVRGRLVTVMNLSRRFRLLEQAPTRRSRILLVAAPEAEPVGLLVDEVVQVYRLTDAEIEQASVLGGEQPPHIAGIGRPPGVILILLDLKPILEP
jgi:purine-binding chemotaxis protein CheW